MKDRDQKDETRTARLAHPENHRQANFGKRFRTDNSQVMFGKKEHFNMTS